MAPPSSSKPLDLPVVSFSLLPEDQHAPPHLEHSGPQFIQFGYNDGKEWKGYHECSSSAAEGGGRYMRWIQPLESELAKQVEYDMDELDKVWLDTFNAERKKEAIAPIAYEVFEVVMDKIEKEWFDLTKSIPKKSNAIPSENEKCAICDDGECENSNAIVFCDGCNLAVHQDCYGVPYIPEGQWLCRKCTVSPDKPVDCVFCPQPFGAFKQTTTGHWGHLLCAIWIPETGVSNTVYMEPIDGVENVPKSRWKLNCYLCKKKLGACIQCSNRNCYTAYHVTCAREFGLEVRMKQPGSTGTNSGGELKSYCDKHGKVNWESFSQSRAATTSSTRIPAFSHHSQPQLLHQHPPLTGSASLPALPFPSTGSTSLPYPQSAAPPVSAAQARPALPLASSKSLRSKKTHLSPIKQTPVVPNFIFDRIVAYISRVKGLTGKKEVVSSICRYWSLKREGRTGAPLLKRIHLEPWTASATSRLQSDADRASKLELIKLLRTDLERVRMLTEQVRKREKKKLERLRWFKETVLDGFIWPKETRLKEALKEIAGWDKQLYFLNPIDRKLVPDYHEIISHPMNWSTMTAKLDRHEYATAQSFADDAKLVMANAQTYNKPSSPIHKHALKIIEKLEPLLATLVRELDDPASELSVREQLASTLLLEEFAFDPDAEKADTSEGQDESTEKKDTVVVLEELQRVWYDVEDPLGDRKAKAEEAERERIRQAKAEEERIEREKREVEAAERQKKKEQEREEAEVRERARELEEQRAQEERAKGRGKAKGKGKGKGKEPKEEQADDVEMAPPKPTTAKDKKKKRKAEDPDRGGDAGASAVKKQKKTAIGDAALKKDTKVHVQDKLGTDQGKVPSTTATETEQGDGAETVISNRDTFKMFETGWVLPEGSSRRKPATPVTSAILLPSPSAPSVTLPPAASSSTPRPAPRGSAAPLPSTKAATPDKKTAPKSVPASRKGKEKASDDVLGDLRAEEQTHSIAVNTPPVNFAQAVRNWQHEFATLGSSYLVTDTTELLDGTLVWHRLPGMNAFYPAEIADPNGTDMPPSLIAARPKDRGGQPTNRVPLLYFDDSRSGAWALRQELRLMGEDEKFDKLLLTPEAVKTYCRQKSQKQCVEYVNQLNDAYEFALSVVEIDGMEEEGSAVPDKKKRAPTKRKKVAANEKGSKKVALPSKGPLR